MPCGKHSCSPCYSYLLLRRCLDFSIADDVLVIGGEHGDLIVMEFSSGKTIASHKYDGGVFDVKYVASRRSCVCATLTSDLDLSLSLRIES